MTPTQEFWLELLKTGATMAVPLIALLRTRADLDLLWAKRRGGAKFMRKRWYHRLKGKKWRRSAEDTDGK